MESFSNSCRLCLWKGDKMLPIFTSPDDDETASKIRKCLPLDVRWEDSLPKGICASCLYKVEMLYEFHCSSVRVDSLLRKYLASELKDFVIKEQQLSNSGYQVTGVHAMRSVAIGTEDEYVPSTRIRECSAETEPMIARVRVRTPYDISEVNSVRTAPMVLLPLRQSDPKSNDGCTTPLSSLTYRSDSAQSIGSASIHACGVTEQSAASNTILRLSGTTTYQEEGSRHSEIEAHTSSQGEACVTGHPKSAGETDIMCLSMKSSMNADQNDLSTPRSCECGDDDEVVVLAEYQKAPQPPRRCKTPTPFDSSSNSGSPSTHASTSTSTSTLQGDCSMGPRRKTQRLCARHQEYLRRMNLQQEKQRLQQQGVSQHETQQGADQLPPRASEQAPATSASSAGPTLPDTARQIHCDHSQQAAQDQSSVGVTSHPIAETSSNSTQPEQQVQLHAQSRPACGATSSMARCVSSELSHNTNRPGQLKHVCHATSAKHGGTATEMVGVPLSSHAKCNSSVPEPQDQPRQAISVQPPGTTAESLQKNPCGSTPSSADAPPPPAAVACMLPPATPLPPATSAVPSMTPGTTPIPAPPSSAALPKNPVLTSSPVPPRTPATTESAAPPIATSSVARPTATSNSGRNATHSSPPGRSPSGGPSPSSSTAQKRCLRRSRTRTNSKSPSGILDHSSKSPVSSVASHPTTPPTPSATRVPQPQTPLTASIMWPLSAAQTPSPSVLSVSPQLQQQETRQQRVLLSAHSSAQPEHQLIPAKRQDRHLNFPSMLVVGNDAFNPTTQSEQQGNVSPGVHAISPGTATTNLSAETLPSATPQLQCVPKEVEQKQQSEQTRLPQEAISQLIAASALISPPRGSKQPEQQVNKPREVRIKSPSQLAAMHLPTSAPHTSAQPKQNEQKSQVQCEQEKNGQQKPRDKLSGKTGRQPTASSIDTENKGGSVKTGQTLLGADQQLTATSQMSKRKKEQRSHSVLAELLASPAKNAAASPSSEQPKKIKEKHCTEHSLTERSRLKSPEAAKSSTEIAEKMKQTPQVAESQLSGGTAEQHQTTKALQNSDVSQKWKKKKKRNKEKEEEGSRHQSSHKSQQEQLSHKRKHPSRNSQQPEDPPSKRAPAPSPQQNQKMETASRHCSSQSQSVTTKYELSGGKAEQVHTERWRNVQQDAVECVRSATQETAQRPLPDDTTSLPTPSSTAKTPSPPVLTPQRLSVAPFSPGCQSPPLPMLPPAVSAAPHTDAPQFAGPRLQCASPPSGEKSPPTPFLTPPKGDDWQKSRLQHPPKAAADTGERRLRTPSPAASTGSGDWPLVPSRSGTSPRRYYNRKRKHLETSGAAGSSTEEAAGSARCETPEPPSQPAITHTAEASAAHPEQQQQAVPSAIPTHGPSPGAPLVPQQSARVFRYSCRYCRQRFRARILLSLHRVNGACELHRSHNYARSGGGDGSDRQQVTERELMLAARVRLERLYACPRCSRVLSCANTLKWHLAVRHGRDNPRDTRSTLQTRWPTSTPPDVLPTLPLLLPPPLTSKSLDSKDSVLEALGLTRKM